jgi:predicted dehydrogenase
MAAGGRYLFQPVHQALLAVAASGRLGNVSHAQVAAAHGYHGPWRVYTSLRDS